MIVAVGPNNLIGCKDKLCWNLPEELKFFKQMTLNGSLFMGQRTFEGLPKKLPNRTFYVLGKSEPENADHWLSSVEEASRFLKDKLNSEDVIWIAGGKFVYETFYQFADEIYVSEVETNAQGDVYLDVNFANYKKSLFTTGEGFKTYLYKKGE